MKHQHKRQVVPPTHTEEQFKAQLLEEIVENELQERIRWKKRCKHIFIVMIVLGIALVVPGIALIPGESLGAYICLGTGLVLISYSLIFFYNSHYLVIDEGSVRTFILEQFQSSYGVYYKNNHYRLKVADEAQEIHLEVLKKELELKELELEKLKQQANQLPISMNNLPVAEECLAKEVIEIKTEQ